MKAPVLDAARLDAKLNGHGTSNGASSREAEETRNALTELWDLPGVGLEVKVAKVSGLGSSARVAIELSNGEIMQFDSIKEMSSATVLAAELVACAGALPKVTRKEALLAIKYVRQIARWERTQTAADIASDWGLTFLQGANHVTADLSVQAERWAAFSRLRDTDPYLGDRLNLSAALVLNDSHDSTRWVRSSWFHSHVRTTEKTYSQQQLAGRMAEVGWTRRGASGRIKATRPGFGDVLGWSFFIVPAGWEDRS